MDILINWYGTWLIPKIATLNHEFAARLANRPFLVFDFWALARVPESHTSSSATGVWQTDRRANGHTMTVPALASVARIKTSQPGIESLSHCPHFGTVDKNGLTHVHCRRLQFSHFWFPCIFIVLMMTIARVIVRNDDIYISDLSDCSQDSN